MQGHGNVEGECVVVHNAHNKEQTDHFHVVSEREQLNVTSYTHHPVNDLSTETLMAEILEIAGTHVIGTLFLTVRHFVVTKNPSTAINKNWKKVMVCPAAGSSLQGQRITHTHTHIHRVKHFQMQYKLKQELEQ